MTARVFPHHLTPDRPPQIGLVVLQEDETIEPDFRRLLPDGVELLTTRVPSGTEVTPETLAAMERYLGGAVALLPGAARFAALAYGCTSGSAQIGPATVNGILASCATTRHVTNPVTALIAACQALGVRRIALLSPYMESVSDQLRRVLAQAGIDTPVFGTFDVAEEARVVRIAPDAIAGAATALLAQGGAEALFLSCTNLRTLPLIATLEARLGLPVLSSNQVLAWHMCRLAGMAMAPGDWGRLSTLDLPPPG